MHPKTHIVILGSESRGKVFAAKCLTRVFKEYDLTTTAATPIVDFSDYPAGTDFIIFLSDLYFLHILRWQIKSNLIRSIS